MSLLCRIGLHSWRDRFLISHLDGTGQFEATICTNCGRINDVQWPPDDGE